MLSFAKRDEQAHDGALLEKPINSIIWCAVGLLAGGAAAMMRGGLGRIAMIENLAVGIFGAFLGGEFLAAMFGSAAAGDTDFHIASLGMAVGGAVVLLVALGLIRGPVAPLAKRRAKAGRARP